MIKGAPVISEATAIPEASVTTEVQKYPAEVLRCSCFCFCGDQVQKLLLRFCFVGTLEFEFVYSIPAYLVGLLRGSSNIKCCHETSAIDSCIQIQTQSLEPDRFASLHLASVVVPLGGIHI